MNRISDISRPFGDLGHNWSKGREVYVRHSLQKIAERLNKLRQEIFDLGEIVPEIGSGLEDFYDRLDQEYVQFCEKTGQEVLPLDKEAKKRSDQLRKELHKKHWFD